MEISSTLQSPGGNSQSVQPSSQSSAALSSDFETFIKMLTVQMENQDPLNPVEASDFAVQLATFSNVEQQVLTNNLLTSLGDQIGAQSVAQLSGWVGMEARAQMPVEFGGAPITLSLQSSSLADTTELVVRNSRGDEVARQTLPKELGEFEWVGVDDRGNPLPYGTYEISVESFSSGESIGEVPAGVHALIVEASNDNGVPALRMDSGQTVSAAQILGLRNPDS